MGSQRKPGKLRQKKSNWLKNERKTISGGNNIDLQRRCLLSIPVCQFHKSNLDSSFYNWYFIGIL